MKIIINSIFICLSSLLFAQVAIGKEINKPSAILDFGPDNGTAKKGIILPLVNLETTDPNPVNGTIIMDRNTKIIKVFENDIWLDLSDEGSLEQQFNTETPPVAITTAAVINQSEEVGDGVIIGATTSTADGILVLESTDKALILPKVADPHLNILSPVAGTMCYDTTSNSLAIFDGKVWNYWK